MASRQRRAWLRFIYSSRAIATTSR